MLTVGQGDTGQLGLGEDVMEKTRPQVNMCFRIFWMTLGEILYELFWVPHVKPQVVAGIESAVDVAAGGMHTAVLDSNGKVSAPKLHP